MTRRTTPLHERLLEDPAGLRIQPPAPTERLVEDGVGLVVSQPGRMVEQGVGLLVTPPAALTAAPGGDDVDRSPDPWQEQRAAAAADLARWEARLEAGARKALAAWTAVAATAVLEDRYLTAAPGDGSMLPPDPNAIPALGSTWSKIADTHIVRLVSELLGEVFARFLRDDEVISARPWQDAYLDEVSNRLSSVADSTFDLVRGVVQDGIDEGASIPDIRDRVQESLDAGGEVSWAHRAQTIARTETIGAYNGGHLAAWSAVEELTGDPVDKVWLATIDPRTRDSHFRADGQRVPLGEPFRVGGHDLAFPGDPTAPAEEVINCRCTMLELDPSDPLPDVSERGFRDAGEVAGEIARRAEQDPPVVRAFDDPEASLQAAPGASSGRPPADVVARMDAIFRASYEDRLDPLLTDEAVVDPAVVTAILDAAAGGSGARPDEAHVARMDAIYRASYADTSDPLLVDEAVVDPALLAAELGRALTAAGLGGLAHGDSFDPNQKRDENGKWTKHGVGISIKVKDAPDERASFAAPTEALLRVAFEHDLTGSDGKTYRSRVTTVDVRAGLSDVQGVLEDADGNRVGKFERTIRQTENGPQAHHGSLVLDKEHQGLGLGSEFNQKAEAVYRAAGVTHVATSATSTLQTGYVGGYVWARRGFGWADEFGPKRAATALRQASPYKNPDPAVADMIERLQTGPLDQRPTPWDVSELQGTPHPDLGGDRRIGRTALLNTTWNGVRWLPADDRTDVEPDPAPEPLPAVSLPDGASFTTPDEALARATWEHELTGSDGKTYRSEVTAVNVVPKGAVPGTALGGSMTVGIVIKDRSGVGIGDGVRIVMPTEDGPKVIHEELFIQPSFQGLGLGSELNRRAEASYRAAGVTHITLEAWSKPSKGGVGGYVWARRGYGWADTTGPRNLSKALRKASPAGADPEVDALVARLEKPKADDLASLPTPFELSELPAGKAALLKTSWNGVRWLPTAEEAAAPEPDAPAGEPEPSGDAEPVRGGLADADLADLAAAGGPATGPERLALESYRGEDYRAMNAHLRGLMTAPLADDTAQHLDVLRGLADRHRLTWPVEVYRGVMTPDAILPPRGEAVGTVITDPGFMSTATARDVATDFAIGPKSALFRITVPEGHPVIPMDGLIGVDAAELETGGEEHELVLPPGSALRITGEETDETGRRVIVATVLPYGGPEAKAAAEAAVPVEAPAGGALTGADADKALSALVTKDLPDRDKQAVTMYGQMGYLALNSALRTGTVGRLNPTFQEHITRLRSVADAHALSAPVEVHRGMINAGVFLPPPGSAVGTVVTDPGFMSTSTDEGIASEFTNWREDGAVFRLTVPAGHPVIPLDQLKVGPGKDPVPASDHPGVSREFEVVLPPGTSFRITGEETVGGVRHITGEVLPYAGPVEGVKRPLSEDDLDVLDYYGNPARQGVDLVPDADLVDQLVADGLLEQVPGKPAWKKRLTDAGRAALDPDSGAATPVASAPPAAAPATGADADRVLSALVTEDLDPGAYMALTGYTTSTFTPINEHLRGLGGDLHADLLTEVDALRAAADAHRLPEPIQVQRGMKFRGDADRILPPQGSAVGTVVTDPGFMSTTTDPDVAAVFSQSKVGTLFKLNVPGGHPVIPVDQALAGPGEALPDRNSREFEVVLPPGSSFRITGDEMVGDRRVITADVLPYAEAAPDVDVPAVEEPTTPARAYRTLLVPSEGDAFLREHFDPKALSKPEKEALGYWTNGRNYRQVNELMRTGSLELKVVTQAPVFAPDPNGGLKRMQAPVYGSFTVHSSDEIRALSAEYPGNDHTLTLLANQLDNLPAAIDKHQMPEDMSLFRVAALPELAHADPASLVGRTISDRGYVATSTSEKSAVLVTQEALGVAGDDAVLFEIRTPAGTPFATPEIKLGTVNGQKLGGYTRVQEVLLHPSSFRVVEVRDDEVSTDGYSLKNGALVTRDGKAKRPATKVRRIVVELVDPADAAVPAPTVVPAVAPPAPEIARVTTWTPEQAHAALADADRSSDGSEYMARAFHDAELFGDVEVLVAEDADGKPLAALSLVRHTAEEEGDTDFLLISYLGSTTPGGGRALADEARQRAIEQNEKLYLEATPDSIGFWTHMGAVEDPYGEGSYYLGFPETFAGSEDDGGEGFLAPETVTTDVPPAVVEMSAAPAVDGPTVPAVTPGAPAVKLTAPRVAALEYYDVAPGERSGKAPNYSVYMPLVKAGLVEKDANGRLVLTDAGRDARTTPGAPDAAPPAPDAPVEPAGASAATAPSPTEAAAARLSEFDAFEQFRPAADVDSAGKAAVRAYVDENNYPILNGALRDAGGDPLTKDHLLGQFDRAFAESVVGDRLSTDLLVRAAELDRVIADAPPSEQPTTLYRGVADVADVFGTDDPNELVGSTLVDRAYLSTTANPDVGEYFAGGADRGGPSTTGAMLRINAPAGTRGLQVGAYQGPGGITAGREGEVLMPRGTGLRVTAVSTERTYDGRDLTVIDVDLLPADDRRDATPGRPAEAAPAASRPSAAPDSPADSADADAGDGAAAALVAEQAAAEAKAEKKRAAAAKRAEKKRAQEEADRAAALEAVNDDAGVPMKLTYDYLSALSDEEREDVEVHLIEQLTAGDPMAEQRLDDLALFNQAQVAEQEIAEQEDRLGTGGVSEEINSWHDRNGRPGLTHPLVGGTGASGDVLGVPSMKQVQEEYRQFVYEQWLKAEEATRGVMVTARGERLGKTGLDMFSSHRGVADVMQYASEELLDWFESNRRIAWAEFYYERTRSSGYAAKAAAAKAVSHQINRDRSALKADAGLPTGGLVAAARRAPGAPVEPTEAQLDAYAAGRAAVAAGEPATVCPFAPSKDRKDHHGLFTLWVRGYVAATVAAFTARRVAEGLLPDPDARRLGWDGGDVLVLEPTAHDGDPGDRLLVGDNDLEDGPLPPALTASARLSGHTVTAAGSGPGDSSATEGRPPMPRTWVSAPHLAPFGVPTGDGRIFKVGSLTARELPLPLLFQPSSGMGHDGSVVVGRILAVEFTDVGVVASGDYLDADPEKAPDLSKAIEQAIALTESGLGHVSVDLSDVVGELVDEDGNPVSMEDIFDAWDRGEDPKVLEQISEGKLIAVTQVATPAFEGAKIELSAAPAAVDGEAALQDTAGADIGVGDVVDVETDEGAIRGEVTAVDEESETVTVQPTDDDGAPAGDVLEVPPTAVTVVTPAADETPDAEDAAAEQVASLVAAAGPLRPPAAWFEDPKLPGPTAMTITDDGRIYGHVAVWGACHVGFSNTCVTPPESPSSYKHFHVGEVVTEDGTRVAVGNLTLGGRHADVRLAYRSAIEHYDVSGAGVAVVRCYEDEHGIAFAGALTPGTTEEQIYDMRRSPVSGDWRRVGGELEMIGVLSVNAGGFNTPRFATDEAGRTALVAAPSVRPMDEEAIVAAAGGGRRAGVLSQAQLIDRITRDATAAVRRELAEESSRAERNRRLAGLAVSIKADPRSRLQRLAATVDAPKRQARSARLAELATLVTR